MKKPEIAKRMARHSKTSVAEAADSLDRTVRQIVSDLRRGKRTTLPGIGQLLPDGARGIAFHREGNDDHA
jgi:nucleoid DNA-binding protein